MRDHVNMLFARAKHILETEGLVSLVNRSLVYMGSRVFWYYSVYLYEHSTMQRNEEQFRPKIDNLTFKIISTSEHADELVKDGFEDIHWTPVIVDVRKCLDNGAIAFCFFVNKELTHIGWVGLSEKAKNCFDGVPYHVDFSHNQACTGGTVTIPKYGAKGLMQYGYFKRFQFLRERGYSTSRNAVARNNTIAQRAHAKFAPEIYAKAYYLQIFRWRFWKESPITAGDGKNHPIDTGSMK